MRKVIFGGANSLDNYFARTDGSVDWLLWSDEAMELMKDFWPRFDTIIMGRKTWSTAQKNFSEEELEQTNQLYAGMKVYMFSRSLPPGLAAGDIEIVNSDPGAFVRKLKEQEGKDICIMGGGDLARTLLEAGVIDEIGFNIHPVLLGSGVPLFHEMSRQIDLELLECKPMKTGCVYVLYRVLEEGEKR
ncbi:MAG: dihydrofolate reductase family protein [Pyrinomonadaceae bacterium]